MSDDVQMEVRTQRGLRARIQDWLEARGWWLIVALFGLALLARALHLDVVWPVLIVLTLLLIVYVEGRHRSRVRALLPAHQHEEAARDAGARGALMGLLVGTICGAGAAARGYAGLAFPLIVGCGLAGGMLGRLWGRNVRKRTNPLTRTFTLMLAVVTLALVVIGVLALAGAF